jgi:PST family polysaccharide transporter
MSWVSTIIVARLLTPYDYGIIGMASLYVNLAMYVSQAGVGDAIIALRDLTRRQIAELNTLSLFIVSAARTPSCKDSRRNAMLRHDQALKEGLDEVAKAGFRAVR